MNNNEAPAPLAAEPFAPTLLPSLLRLTAARSAGEIGGPEVEAKIADIAARAAEAGLIVSVRHFVVD